MSLPRKPEQTPKVPLAGRLPENCAKYRVRCEPGSPPTLAIRRGRSIRRAYGCAGDSTGSPLRWALGSPNAMLPVGPGRDTDRTAIGRSPPPPFFQWVSVAALRIERPTLAGWKQP